MLLHKKKIVEIAIPLAVCVCFVSLKNVFLCTAQDVLVYLCGESAVHLTIEGLGSVNAQDLGRSVREALNIAESAQDTFAFWLCSPLLGRSPFLSQLINAEIATWSFENLAM